MKKTQSPGPRLRVPLKVVLFDDKPMLRVTLTLLGATIAVASALMVSNALNGPGDDPMNVIVVAGMASILFSGAGFAAGLMASGNIARYRRKHTPQK
jgi:hypothetical protein